MRAVPLATAGLLVAALLVPLGFAQSTLPDFAVTSVGVSPGQPAAGDAVTIAANVRNLGSAAGQTWVAFYIDGRMIDARFVQLSPGANLLLQSAPWTATAGHHQAIVKADPNNQVEESNEWNNAATKEFDVVHVDPAPADLALLALYPNRAPIREGDWVTFFASVTNEGATASQASIVRFNLDTFRLGDVQVPALAPGESFVVASPQWCAFEGRHSVAAVVDPEAAQPDGDRSDNGKSVAIDVLPRIVRGVDLAPEDQSGTFLPAQTQRFTLRVTNTGNDADTIRLAAEAPSGWRATLDHGFVSLAAGGSTDVTVTITAPVAVTGQAVVTVRGTSTHDAAATDDVRVHASLLLP